MFKINKKIEVFLGDQFLTMNFLLSCLFWLFVFTFGTISFIDCRQGYSNGMLVAVCLFMAFAFFVDCVNFRQHIQKEIAQAEVDRRDLRWWAIGLEAVYQMVMTQVGVFDFFTDFAFVNMCFWSEELYGYFVASVIFFSITFIPKLYAIFLYLKIRCKCNKEVIESDKIAAKQLR